MDFGITIKPDISIDRILSLTRHAESSGFSFGWIFDSHVIWKEPFPLLTLMASNTKKMRLGTCVTNPAVRDVTVSASLFATLNLASQDRKSTRLNSSHLVISYAVFCLKKKINDEP